jgi:hypothetical protein
MVKKCLYIQVNMADLETVGYNGRPEHWECQKVMLITHKNTCHHTNDNGNVKLARVVIKS